MSTHSASSQMLGYLYQVRYALFLILEQELDYSISIESLDDITFEEHGTPKELIQTKHHTTKNASVADTSSDLWRTIRVWCDALKKGKINPDETVLTLVTTSKATSENIIAQALYPEGTDKRDVDKALALLEETANSNSNQSNKKAYEEFLLLTKEERRQLVKAIRILDGSPNIIDTREKIKKILKTSTRKEFLEEVLDRLEGWWFEKTIQFLMKRRPSVLPITQEEVLNKLNDITEQYHKNNLPIYEIDFDIPSENDLSKDKKVFIEQLKLIMLRPKRVQQAISDYIRAYEQRSRWIRNDLLFDDELIKYEKILIDEWERKFEAMLEQLDFEENKAENTLVNYGRGLYNTIQDMEINIREKCTEPFIMRGSYHILANEMKVGWHAEFKDRLRHLLNELLEEVT
jgi:hypothetical protein